MQSKAEKYRIAAEIEETGKEWEVRSDESNNWRKYRQPLGFYINDIDFEIRIKPEPEPVKLIPLEWTDVPPGSVFRQEGEQGWISPDRVTVKGIWHLDIGCGVKFTFFTSLHQAYWHILRPGGEWQPCSKPAPKGDAA